MIGGGISGISISEILSRNGHKTILIEKNHDLASETSKVFHEWLHSGVLYSLGPDNLLTLRYLLGATDDLFEFYGSYKRMNLLPSERGISFKKLFFLISSNFTGLLNFCLNFTFTATNFFFLSVGSKKASFTTSTIPTISFPIFEW